MPQTSGLAQTLNSVVGPVVSTGFSPFSAVSVIQNYQINRGIEKLSEGMVLMQNLQYGTLALSGLGLGVSIAGFAATLIKLQGKTSLSPDVVDRLWALAAAIRICQDASIQALFAANELDAAASLAQAELNKQMALMNAFTPDAMSRMIARSEPDPLLAFELPKAALPKVKVLVNGLRGGLETLAGLVSIAQTLATQKMNGLDYLREARETKDARLLCLTPPRTKSNLSWRYFTSGAWCGP